MFNTEVDQRFIFFKKLRKVNIFSSFIRLLVKINGAYPVLEVFNIRRDIYYKIVGSHISEQTNKTTFIKFYKLFCKTYPVGNRFLKIIRDKNIAGDTGYVILNQCMLVRKKANPVGRQ